MYRVIRQNLPGANVPNKGITSRFQNLIAGRHPVGLGPALASHLSGTKRSWLPKRRRRPENKGLLMPNSVNTNVGAMVALQNLNQTNADLFTTQNRINTGKKVASAKD